MVEALERTLWSKTEGDVHSPGLAEVPVVPITGMFRWTFHFSRSWGSQQRASERWEERPF